MNPQTLGVGKDTRSPEQIEYDYKHSELYASSVPSYLGSLKDASTYVGIFPIDNQYQTSSCVAHGKCLATSIFNYLQGRTHGVPVQLSSMYLYRQRVNYPTEGMIPNDANMLTIHKGTPLYADMPTPQTEEEANALTINSALDDEAGLYAAGKWVTLEDPSDIDTLAFISNSLVLPITIIIFATIEEWRAQTVDIRTPNLTQSDPLAVVEHCVTILPKSAYTDAQGVKRVVIQDSAIFGGFAYRFVSEDFIKARCTSADYPILLGNHSDLVKPSHIFSTDLTIGSTGPDVVALQECLQFAGYFPSVVNGQPFKPTGTYGGLTKNAVAKFQTAYAAEILTPNGLTSPTGYVGSSTRAQLNVLFN